MSMSSPEITIDTLIVRADTTLSAEVGNEVVMLVPDRNSYYDTNAQGAAVWNALNQPTTVRAICARLIERFDVAEPDCQRDVLAFVREGVTEGLIRLAE